MVAYLNQDGIEPALDFRVLEEVIADPEDQMPTLAWGVEKGWLLLATRCPDIPEFTGYLLRKRWTALECGACPIP